MNTETDATKILDDIRNQISSIIKESGKQSPCIEIFLGEDSWDMITKCGLFKWYEQANPQYRLFGCPVYRVLNGGDLYRVVECRGEHSESD